MSEVQAVKVKRNQKVINRIAVLTCRWHWRAGASWQGLQHPSLLEQCKCLELITQCYFLLQSI